MIEKIHAFFNRGKKQVKWEENIFVPIVKTIKPPKATFNEVFENTIKK